MIEVKEQFKVLYLNRANQVIAWEEHSTGGQHSTVAGVRIIMSASLQCLASSLILALNHPSENLRPSLADERLTKKITEAAKLFDICLLDHLILAREGYYSFLHDGKGLM